MSLNRRAGSRPWFVLQHVAHEGPGTIAGTLSDRGIEFRLVRVDDGDPVPAAAEIAEAGGLVVMGGPMSVGDGHSYPWLVDERTALAEAVSRGVPVLGVCLGAQQLAAALGADVHPADRPEVGAGRVVLTPAGRRDRVFGPEHGGLAPVEVPCFHWHAETFDLPPGAVHLAATADCPNQAFRAGDAAYGLQFHVEVDAGLARAWRDELPAGTAASPAEVSAIETAGRRLLGRFVDLALG